MLKRLTTCESINAIVQLYYSSRVSRYDTVEASADSHGVSMPSSWSQDDVEEWLSEHATAINEGRTPDSSADLFEQGFDRYDLIAIHTLSYDPHVYYSLSATFLRNRILGAFRSSPDPFVQAAAATIPADIVFANPTIQWLAAVVSHFADPSATTSSAKTPTSQIEEMIAKYTKDLPVVKGKRHIDPADGLVVVLTGSTGGLGSHLLADLVKNEGIKKVYTFDRSENVQDKQKIAFEDRSLPTNLLKSEKLHSLTVNASRNDFGLASETLEEVKFQHLSIAQHSLTSIHRSGKASRTSSTMPGG